MSRTLISNDLRSSPLLLLHNLARFLHVANHSDGTVSLRLINLNSALRCTKKITDHECNYTPAHQAAEIYDGFAPRYLHQNSSPSTCKACLWPSSSYSSAGRPFLSHIDVKLFAVVRIGGETLALTWRQYLHRDTCLSGDAIVISQLAGLAVSSPATLLIWGLCQ